MTKVVSRIVNGFKRFWLALLLSPLLGAALFVVVAQLVPDAWLRARPQGDSQTVDVAIVLGFGYEEMPQQAMKPGAANEFLLQWVLDTQPQVKTILAQEGVWVARCLETDAVCHVGDVELLRIHRHDPALDVNTLQTAVCAIERMRDLGASRAVLVAHDLQLWRTAADFERARQTLSPDFEFVVPMMPDTPYPAHSAQWRTRNEFIYRVIELLARFRDSERFTPVVPETCIAPL